MVGFIGFFRRDVGKRMKEEVRISRLSVGEDGVVYFGGVLRLRCLLDIG